MGATKIQGEMSVQRDLSVAKRRAIEATRPAGFRAAEDLPKNKNSKSELKHLIIATGHGKPLHHQELCSSILDGQDDPSIRRGTDLLVIPPQGWALSNENVRESAHEAEAIAHQAASLAHQAAQLAHQAAPP